MELRSLQITMYVGALALIAACGSSTPNSSPFEAATNNLKPDASTFTPAPAPTTSSSSNSNNNKPAATACKTDNDCGNACPSTSAACCCDPMALTCYGIPNGSCPSNNNNSGGDDGGGSNSGDDGGGSSGDDSGGGMQMMP
jgi:hypothetical protein